MAVGRIRQAGSQGIVNHCIPTWMSRYATVDFAPSLAAAPAKPRPDEAPIRAIVRAHRWKRMLDEESTGQPPSSPRPKG